MLLSFNFYPNQAMYQNPKGMNSRKMHTINNSTTKYIVYLMSSSHSLANILDRQDPILCPWRRRNLNIPSHSPSLYPSLLTMNPHYIPFRNNKINKHFNSLVLSLVVSTMPMLSSWYPKLNLPHFPQKPASKFGSTTPPNPFVKNSQQPPSQVMRGVSSSSYNICM